MNFSGTSERILAQGVQALEAVAAQSMALDDWLDRKADKALRRALSSLLFTFFRKKRAVDAALNECWERPPRPEVGFLLELALTLAKFQTALPPESAVNVAVAAAKRRFGTGAGKFVNAVLRRALPKVRTDAPPEELLPEAVAERWRKSAGEKEFQVRAELFQCQVPTVLRWRAGFAGGIPLEYAPLTLDRESPWRFTLSGKGPLAQDALFEQGQYYIQDPAPAQVAMLLEAAELPERVRLLDLCAAPGGKLLLALEYLATRGVTAEATALDRSAHRQERTRENLARCHAQAVLAVGDAATWRPEDGSGFDLILADVPCTNTGVFRRRPDALWRWSAKALAAMTAVQRSILEHGAELCRRNGYLLYSTCSLEAEENALLVAAFLAKHREFALIRELALEAAENHDAAYGALLRREG